jgi:hypothetical protein
MKASEVAALLAVPVSTVRTGVGPASCGVSSSAGMFVSSALISSDSCVARKKAPEELAGPELLLESRHDFATCGSDGRSSCRQSRRDLSSTPARFPAIGHRREGGEPTE